MKIEAALIALAIAILFAIPFVPQQEVEVPASTSAVGGTNTYIGAVNSCASDPASWSLGSVPVDGDNIQFDARGGTGNIRWDIDLKPNDFTMLENSTSVVVMSRHDHGVHYDGYLDIKGNLTILGVGYIVVNCVGGSISIKNFAVEGWTHLRGNTSGSSSPRFTGSFYNIYFNGPFDVQYPTKGSLSFNNCNVVFNETVTINGTWRDRDATHAVLVSWSGSSYLHFKKETVFQGIHALSMGAGRADANMTFVDIAPGAHPAPATPEDPAYVAGWLLMKNDYTGALPFTFYESPRFVNITKTSDCGWSPYIEVRFSGELNLSYWNGHYSDFFGKVDINTVGTVSQSYSAEYGSIMLPVAGILNVFNGTYRLNGSHNLFIAPGMNIAIGDDHTGNLNVYSNFELGSGTLITDYVNLNGGTFRGQSGIIRVNNFDSSNGTFIAGNSTLLLSHVVNYSFYSSYYHSPVAPLLSENENPPGTIKTDGTPAGGLWNLHIGASATATLLSDVWVNGNYSNKGTVQYNGFSIFNNGTVYDGSDALTDAGEGTTSGNGTAYDRLNVFTDASLGVASDPASWSLGHIPLAGESVLIDARAAAVSIVYDIDVEIDDFTILSNFTREITFTAPFHITGDLTILSRSKVAFVIPDGENCVIEGSTYLRGNNSGKAYPDIIFATAGTSAHYYFNGSFDAQYPTKAKVFFDKGVDVVFNSTVVMNGTWRALSISYKVDIGWIDAYLHFKGDVIFRGIHYLTFGAGSADANISIADIGQTFLIKNSPYGPTPFVQGTLPFVFHTQPVITNITECDSCGWSPYIELRYDGEFGDFGIFEGYYSDYFYRVDINTSGSINQTTSVQFGGPSVISGILNVFNGTYRINGPFNLILASGQLTVWNDGMNKTSELNVRSTFELGSGFLIADYVNLDNGAFFGQNGQMEVDHWGSSNGTFVAGASIMYANHTAGTLKTDGTGAQGFNILSVGSDATYTLLSDVYVTGAFIDNGGTIILNGFHLYLPEPLEPKPTLAKMVFIHSDSDSGGSDYIPDLKAQPVGVIPLDLSEGSKWCRYEPDHAYLEPEVRLEMLKITDSVGGQYPAREI